MRTIAIFCALLLSLSGCSSYEHRDVWHEAIVTDTAFVPSGRGSDLAVGYTTSGSVTLTPIDVEIAERWAVVFKIGQQEYVADGDVGRRLHSAFSKGDKAKVCLRSTWRKGVLAGGTKLYKTEIVDAVAY